MEFKNEIACIYHCRCLLNHILLKVHIANLHFLWHNHIALTVLMLIIISCLYKSFLGSVDALQLFVPFLINSLKDHIFSCEYFEKEEQ